MNTMPLYFGLLAFFALPFIFAAVCKLSGKVVEVLFGY